MDITIEKMLSHVYEIEGLMLVTRRLGEENTPEVITNKLRRKVRELAEMCGVEPQVAPVEGVAAAPEPVTQPVAAGAADGASQPEPSAPVDSNLPEDDYDAEETWQHDNGEEFKEVFSLNYEEPEPTVTEAQAEAMAAVQPPVFRQPVEDTEEPLPDPDPAVVPEDDRDLPDISVEFIEADDDSIPEPTEEMPVPPTPTEFPTVDETPVINDESSSPLRVDEKLQRHMSRDIRKAFSVNDRFRFQRELFAGSASAMNTAIEHIEVMNSYGNAELHFYSQLHWDRDNEVVKDFMAIVRNHFQR